MLFEDNMITDSFTSEHILTEFRPMLFVLVRLNEMLIFTGHETNCNKHRLMQSYTYLDFATGVSQKHRYSMQCLVMNCMMISMEIKRFAKISAEFMFNQYHHSLQCWRVFQSTHCGPLTHTRIKILDQWFKLWVVAYSAHSWHIINQNIVIYTRLWSFCFQRINRLQGYKPGTCDRKYVINSFRLWHNYSYVCFDTGISVFEPIFWSKL